MASAPAAVKTWPDLPERDGYEYVDGKWVKIPMGAESTWVSGELFARLRSYGRRKRTGTALAHETGFQIWPTHPKRYRKPDGAFVSIDKISAETIPLKFVNVVPELVVEVISPSDRVEDVEGKLGEYRDAGIPLIWVIYPRQRRAHVYRLDGSARIVEEDEYLEGEDVLPGFRVRLRDILQPKA